MNDDFDVKMSILKCFIDVLIDAIKRQDMKYLELFLSSDLSVLAVTMWREIDKDTFDTFHDRLRSATVASFMEEQNEDNH